MGLCPGTGVGDGWAGKWDVKGRGGGPGGAGGPSGGGIQPVGPSTLISAPHLRRVPDRQPDRGKLITDQLL